VPGTTRQFEPQIIRSGGIPSKYRFTTRCSECSKAGSYETNQRVNDDVIKGYFKERGWLLGRSRSHDLCPVCLARPRDTKTPREGFARSAHQPEREAAQRIARHKDTADILTRHLGRPEALAAEVFRPREIQAPRPAAPAAARQPEPAPALSTELEQTLIGMAADLKSLRSMMEFMAEQMSKLADLGGQQIESIARLTPLMAQSSERISGELKDVVGAVRLNFGSSDVRQQQPALLIESGMEQDHEASPKSETKQPAKPAAPAKQTRPLRANRSTGGGPVSELVVVKSIPDAKRPDRFYTTIRLPRELWDSSGFEPTDRLLIAWTGKALTITSVSEGGVKPKTINDTAVVLQTWKVGNLNLDQPKVTGAQASLRLVAGKKNMLSVPNGNLRN
jgi:hypothetical protein